MPGRKLLYLLRTVDAVHRDSLLPQSTSSTPQDDISVVLLHAPTPGVTPIPGRMYLLQGESGAAIPPSGVSTLSYSDLLKLIFEVDSTIVL
jgi:hypothetical protein